MGLIANYSCLSDVNLKELKAMGSDDLHPFSWTDIIKLLFGNEFGILPDSFLLI